MDGKAAAAAQLQQQLQQQHAAAAERKSWPRRLCDLLPFLACVVVAVHFVHTTYGVLHDPHDLAFVANAERRMRERLKLYMWTPSTALTAMLACGVSPMVPPPLYQIVWGLVFVVAAYAMLALLFYCLRKFETLTADSCAEIRERIKLPMWALSTALTAMFLCPPSPLNLLVSWVMALLVAIGGFFWLLFSDTWQFGNSLDKWNDEASEMEEKV